MQAAIRTAERARVLAQRAGRVGLARELGARIALFHTGHPFLRRGLR